MNIFEILFRVTMRNAKRKDYSNMLEEKAYILLFSDEQKRQAAKRAYHECSAEEIEKVIHRLLTCSFDIENCNGIYRIYFCGLEREESICYFELDDYMRKCLFKRIVLCKYGNIEEKDFYTRLIEYISFDYIAYDIVKRCRREHIMLMESMEDYPTLTEYVKCYLALVKESGLDFEYKEYSILNELVNQNFYNEIVVGIVVDKLGRFFMHDRKQYLFGSQLKGAYVKFSFPVEKQSEYRLIGGRKFYEYKANTVAEDYLDGCGFSFGELRRAFYYFQYGSYGEQLMFVTPLDDEIYYRRDYEYLGKKLKIGNICSMQKIEVLELVLDNMSMEERERFFCNYESSLFDKTFGTVEKTIEKMKQYDEESADNGYAKAIEYLASKQKEYSA